MFKGLLGEVLVVATELHSCLYDISTVKCTYGTVHNGKLFVNFTAQLSVWSKPIEPTIVGTRYAMELWQRCIHRWNTKNPAQSSECDRYECEYRIIITTITYRQFPFRPFGILYETMVHRLTLRSWICQICSVRLLLMKHDLHSIVSAANKLEINENRVLDLCIVCPDP